MSHLALVLYSFLPPNTLNVRRHEIFLWNLTMDSFRNFTPHPSSIMQCKTKQQFHLKPALINKEQAQIT